MHLNEIKKSVSEYNNFFLQVKDKAVKIREQMDKNKFSFFEEDKSIYQISPCDSFSVAGADSGFFLDNLTSLDFAYVKTAGSYIEYKDKKIEQYLRIPKIPKKELFLSKSILQKDELHKFVSIKRIREEINLLKHILIDKNPDIIAVDGNLLPQAVDRPQNSSKLITEYKEMISDFATLYDKAKELDSILIGCVEDTRATTLIDKLDLDLSRINDTIFSDLILKDKEGLGFFCIQESNQNIINQDLEEFGDYKFYASYIKPSNDYPIRVETTSTKFDLIRSMIGFMAVSKDYSFPSILVDADKRAKLDGSEVQTIKNIINNEFIKFNIRKLRRYRRI